MTRTRLARAVLACALALVPAAAAGVAQAGQQGPPPPPKAANGKPVQVVGQGIPTPTAFAFGDGEVFVSAGGDFESEPPAPGGVYVLEADGSATRLAGSPAFSFGLAWHDGTLYVSAGTSILAWSGWNGTAFTQQTTIYTGPEGFPGFNGLAISPRNGRIYAGTSLDGEDEQFDSALNPAPFANRVVSLKRDGTDIRTETTGLRQPFQLTFVRGIKAPYGTHLGQENLGPNRPPDFVYKARRGGNLGFPTCLWEAKKPCKKFTKFVRLLPAHSSPMGIDSIGSRLYVALFTGRDKGPEVVSFRLGGKSRKQLKTVLSGFVAPVVALGTHKRALYVGDLTGQVYRVEQ